MHSFVALRSQEVPFVPRRALEALKDPKVHMAGPKEFIFFGGKASKLFDSGDLFAGFHGAAARKK